MKALSEKEVKEHLEKKLTNWSLKNNSINREFKFKNFVEAFGFMASVALEAEKLDHHPDWSNSYNKVDISLTNHEAKGITQVDFDLAATIDKLFKS